MHAHNYKERVELIARSKSNISCYSTRLTPDSCDNNFTFVTSVNTESGDIHSVVRRGTIELKQWWFA